MSGPAEVLVPLTFLAIPLAAILSNAGIKAYRMFLDAEKAKHSQGSPDLEKRVRELENRVLTLQDIVISGDYEVRRKLEHQTTPPAPVASQPYAQSSQINHING